MIDPIAAAADPTMAAKIKAYPGTTTFRDLIAKNKRQSAMLIVFMLTLAVALGAVFGGVLAQYMSPREAAQQVAGAAVMGGLAALAAALLATLWSWYGGAGAILSMAGARPIQKQDDPQLFNVVDELRIAAGLPMPAVYLIDDQAMNAFATGRDPAHAAVAITTGLRSRLNRDELQGVLGHEMAHVLHYDIRFSMLMATMVGLIVFACDAFFRIARVASWSSSRTRDDRRDGGGGGGLAIILFILGLLLAMIAPILANFIQLAYSRQREYLADAGSVELTRNPLGLASALQKLGDDDEELTHAPNRGTAHLYIVNPFKAINLDSMFSSHPPIKDRIARLLALTR